jgi:RNA recognition motif. (a.k.a. RRM, RBD, or RNP domain)
MKNRETVHPDSDEDEESLLLAAAQWARTESHSNLSFSLHLTQLSFEVTDYDIRSLFERYGCSVLSVRKVYDRSPGQERKFRGVAFVDVADKKSYETALSLDRNFVQGRRMNVRPTRTKEELAKIVQQTKETVAEKIKFERQKQESSKSGMLPSINESQNPGETNSKGALSTERKKNSVIVKDRASLKSTNLNEKSQLTNNRKRRADKKLKEESHDSKKQKLKGQSSRSHSEKTIGDNERKLTKKERNRRAAIIMTKARKP